MKTEQPILISSVTAQTDIAKHLCVAVDGKLCNDGDKFFGICNADTAQGEEVPVIAKGIAICITDGEIFQGNKVVNADDGKVQMSLDTSLDVNFVGIALDSSTGSDEKIRVLLR